MGVGSAWLGYVYVGFGFWLVGLWGWGGPLDIGRLCGRNHNNIKEIRAYYPECTFEVPPKGSDDNIKVIGPEEQVHDADEWLMSKFGNVSHSCGRSSSSWNER